MKLRLAGLGLTTVTLGAALSLAAGAWEESSPPGPDISRHSALYRALLEADYSSVANAVGLDLAGTAGMMPPAEADRERHWLVYAGFEGRPGRHRISYQVIPPGEHEEFARYLDLYDPCARDEVAWDCFTIQHGVGVKGQVTCLRPRCEPTRKDARALLRAALDQLREVMTTV